MSIALAIAGWTVFLLAILVGIALNAVGLFGNWVILAAIVGLWVATGFQHYSIALLLVMLGLAILGEVVEFFAASVGANRFGGGKGSMLTVLAGCIAGAVVGTGILPVVGSVAGACVGAFAAAMVYEILVMERRTREAAWTGFGAALGKIGGILGKLLVGFIILFLAAIRY